MRKVGKTQSGNASAPDSRGRGGSSWIEERRPERRSHGRASVRNYGALGSKKEGVIVDVLRILADTAGSVQEKCVSPFLEKVLWLKGITWDSDGRDKSPERENLMLAQDGRPVELIGN